tara:strand:+ start:1124 stop:1939 length:816 start_codon:yes stop_codon:yes gene_type:complete
MKVDFVIVGNPKCGSSTLYEILNSQEEIQMSSVKEPGLFHQSDLNVFRSLLNKNFDNTLTLKGEASVGYSIYYDALERIKKHNPEAKIILLCRDPVQRVVSHYWHRVKMDEIHVTLSDLIEKNPNHEIFQFSKYASQIKNLNTIFKKNQILIVKTEMLNDQNSVSEIFRFLDCSIIDKSYIIKRYNTSKIYRSKYINKLINYIRINYNFHRYLPNFIYFPLRKIWNYFKQINLKPFEYPQADQASLEKLSELLEEDIKYYNNNILPLSSKI